MSEVQFDDFDRLVAYAEKQFQLPLLAGCFASERCDHKIPSRAVGLSLLLGEETVLGRCLGRLTFYQG